MQDPESSDNYDEPQIRVKNGYEKLKKVRQNLIEIYNEEFLGNLIYQSVNVKDRYKPVSHKEMKIGDVVLIKEPFAKPRNYPMGIIKMVIYNDIKEITGAIIMKGKTREILKRHISTVIPILTLNEEPEILGTNDCQGESSGDLLPAPDVVENKPRRKAAVASEKLTKLVFQNE